MAAGPDERGGDPPGYDLDNVQTDGNSNDSDSSIATPVTPPETEVTEVTVAAEENEGAVPEAEEPAGEKDTAKISALEIPQSQANIPVPTVALDVKVDEQTTAGSESPAAQAGTPAPEPGESGPADENQTAGEGQDETAQTEATTGDDANGEKAEEPENGGVEKPAEEAKEEVEEEAKDEQNKADKQDNPFDQGDSSESDDSDSEDTASDSTKNGKPLPSRPGMPLLPALGRKLLPKSADGTSMLPVEREWERRKQEFGEKSKALDQLMAMVGLEEVKKEFLAIKATIAAAKQRKGKLRRQDFYLALTGNPGTGKRTLVGIYQDLLTECGLWTDAYCVRRSGFDFQSEGDVENLQIHLRGYNDGTELMLVMDAIENASSHVHSGLLHCLEHHADRLKLVVALTGTAKGMAKFLGSRPNGRWVFPRRLELRDYDDEQLRLILLQLIRHNAFTVEGGEDGPYPRIAAKRVGRGRDSAGFANVYDLVLAFGRMLDRQAARLEKEGVRLSSDPRALKAEKAKETEETENQVEKIDDDKADSPADKNDEGEAQDKAAETTEEKASESASAGIGAAEKSDEAPSPPADGKKVDANQREEAKTSVDLLEQKDAEESTKTGSDETQKAVLSLLTKEDMIGPEPEDIRSTSEAWKELEKMAGLENVKKAIAELLTRARANYRREILGKEPLQTSLNRVFLGPPGTGKTTVAKLYGQILAETGLLSTKEVVFKTPDDFIGEHIGESEMKTSRILDSTIGKVLIIDDAHMFYPGSRAGTGNESDIFRLGVIDTIIAKIHNKPGEDRCVILLGYTDMMEEMIQKVNPGLRRRFPLEEAFRFENYNDEHLNQILRLKMAKENITASEEAMEVAAEVLRRARDRPNFGNGGDVDNLLNQAKARFRERVAASKKTHVEPREAASEAEQEEEENIVLDRADFDPEWNRGTHASTKCRALFQDLIGFDAIVDTFQGYQRMAANLRRRGRDPRAVVPFTFVFKGPPGTGKTHTARIVGRVFYDMGFLSTDEVVECSASQLIGQYMGHTAPKVVNLFERALGKVLFIDEAYRLAGGARGTGGTNSFEDEAIGEIVDCMTKPRYLRKMVIVLAGYDKDMDALLKCNAGLRGRFATEIVFPPMSPARSRELLLSLLRKEEIELRDPVDPGTGEKDRVLRLLHQLGLTPGWSNGRDIKTLAATITGSVYRNASLEDVHGDDTEKFSISTAELNGFLKDMLRQRTAPGTPN